VFGCTGPQNHLTETTHQQRVGRYGVVIERAVGEWRQRLRAFVRAGGGHFQHRL